jgi:leucyl-tRNA synthetase
MEYRFSAIEEKWQQYWKENRSYAVSHDSPKPKCYVLDMFPYPSGAGLHVGHPLGYIASDIYSRYKRLKGYNVLHPMGFDSFGLPAEQYALETGQHPAVTTRQNIETFKKQLDRIGFCYDWSREIRTSEPSYYRWTQWIFLKLFNSYYDAEADAARPIRELEKRYEQRGGSVTIDKETINFSAADWAGFEKTRQEEILMEFRLAFSKIGEVNWCEALGTVLANDEVVNGLSERGGHPVVKKKMRQWFLRITAYAERLLRGLEQVDFSESMKEMQRNWIGRSEGAEISFAVTDKNMNITVFTTRPDTVFGVDFLVAAPELEWIGHITTTEQQAAVADYIAYVKSRSEVDRMAEKKITGCFTGAFAEHPFTGKKIPVWISEYVLAGYGTGAIMAVPSGDERDFRFARHFSLPVTNILGSLFNGSEANPTKEARLENSDRFTGMTMREAAGAIIEEAEKKGFGIRKINYKMRDAGFSRQRYWGEPFPVIWEQQVARPLEPEELPLTLPHVETYGPGREGEGPLANITEWMNVAADGKKSAGRRESSTMPGYAGSSWYFLRFMDPNNNQNFCDRAISDYWNQVDLYVGGTEHAVGHLLYSRMWTKVLFDLGLIGFDEPFKKLLNQGMIQGSSRFVYRLNGMETFAGKGPVFVSAGIYEAALSEKIQGSGWREWLEKKLPPETFNALKTTGAEISVSPLHSDVGLVNGTELNQPAFRKWKPETANACFINEDGTLSVGEAQGTYLCGVEVEKMSKSKYNTVNPDDLCNRYGADTFRMYEMFLGPVEQSKPWDTQGIEGVHRFLKKLWRLFFDEKKGFIVNMDAPADAELKALHRTIRKIGDDTERFSFNTAVSSFMICVNELSELNCHKKEILAPLLVLLSPYAPHIAEELWHELGNPDSIIDAAFPEYDARLLMESTRTYPVSVNGKVRTNLNLPAETDQQAAEERVLQDEVVKKWLEGRAPKRIIFVKDKMINVVV